LIFCSNNKKAREFTTVKTRVFYFIKGFFAYYCSPVLIKPILDSYDGNYKEIEYRKLKTVKKYGTNANLKRTIIIQKRLHRKMM